MQRACVAAHVTDANSHHISTHIKETKFMGYRNSNSISIETTVEVTMEDIKDNVDFDDMIAEYEPSSDDLLKHVDFEDALKHVVDDPQFNTVETIDALLENDELRERLIEHTPRPEAPEVIVIEESPLFKKVKVGSITAVIAGTKVRFKDAQADEVGEFTCADSNLVMVLLQGLAIMQAETTVVAGDKGDSAFRGPMAVNS